MQHLHRWILAAAVITQAGTMDAQTLNWTPAGPPAARCCMGMAYDQATHSTVLFGGEVFNGSVGAYFGDTWTWQSGGWSKLSPAGSPSARYSVEMAYDGAANNVVLFGGQDSTGTYLNDTWTWDGTTWTEQFPPVSPPARSTPDSTGMVYDAATQTVVLFGGGNAGGPLGDTWTWDGIGRMWTQQNPAASPSARSAPIAYDAATQTVVLFGGNGSTTADEFNDTWTWNGNTWTQQFPASAPPARTSASMTFHGLLGMVMLFGGYSGNYGNSLNDTWLWNGITWRQIHPATVPHNRYSFGMDYDPVNKTVLMFGGFSSGPALGDTWLLALAQ
jgi:hypothetical protein